MNDPRIPAMPLSHRRPGFYFRVLEEGEVEAGDEIFKLASGPEQMMVAEVDALLYLPGHPRQQLLRALRIPALSPGWQASFEALVEEEPGAGTPGSQWQVRRRRWPGFRRLIVTLIEPEGDAVISIRLEDPDGASLPAAVAGPYLSSASSPKTAQRPIIPQLLALGTARRLPLPDRGQARGKRSRERLSCTRGSPSTTSSTSPPSGHVHPRPDGSPRVADELRDGDTPALAMIRRWRRSVPSGRSGGCTGRAAAAATPSRRRPALCSRRCRTRGPRLSTAAPARRSRRP